MRTTFLALSIAFAVACSASSEPALDLPAQGSAAGQPGASGAAGATQTAGRGGASDAGGGQAGASDGGVAGQDGEEQEAGQGGAEAAAGSGGAGDAGEAAAGTTGGSGGKAPTFCEPGEVSGCFCADGSAGVAQCNVIGSAAGPCVCQPKPPTCSKTANGCPDKRDFYDCPVGATLPVPGCLQYQGISSFYCCGEPAPATCNPDLVPGEHLPSAKVTSGPAPSWTLPASSVAWLASGEASPHSGPSIGVGVTSSPMEFGAIEVCIGFVCSNGTLGAKDCIGGDKVAREGVEMCCVTGDSSAGGKLPQATITCDHGSTVVRVANKTATCRDLRVTIVD